MLDVIIWTLRGCSPDEGVRITAPLNGYVERMNMINQHLATMKLDTALIERAVELSQALILPSNERNRFVHDTWWLRVATDALYQDRGLSRGELKKLKKGEPFKIEIGLQEKTDEKEADKLIETINSVLKLAYRFYADVSAALDAARIKQ